MGSKIHLIESFWLDVEYFDQSTGFRFLANYKQQNYTVKFSLIVPSTLICNANLTRSLE